MKISNFFSTFELSFPVLKKENVYENAYIVLSVLSSLKKKILTFKLGP